MDPYFHDMPCGSNDPHASIFTKLQKSLVQVNRSSSSFNLVKSFLDSYVALYCDLPVDKRDEYPPNMALAALFDLVVSAKYAERLVADGGWTYCSGSGLSEDPSLFFCYLKTCPRCSVHRGIRPNVHSNKPGSDIIGDICGDATYEILSEVIRINAPSAKMGKNSDRMGDVDFVIYDNDILALGETKSSPLVLYPLEIRLSRPLTEIRNGQRVEKRDHTQSTADVTRDNIYMYIPHRSVRIELGCKSEDHWPYAALIRFVREPTNIKILIQSWIELYKVYKDNLKRGNTDNRKWITCGCGGGVDDSKNKPGMDRTDDIKKGTYQSLKFGTYYKEKDPRRIVKSLVASNFFPLRMFERYLSEMTDVIWTKEKYSRTISHNTRHDLIAFSKSDLFYLYDAIICFTESIYMDRRLKSITSLEEYISRVCQDE